MFFIERKALLQARTRHIHPWLPKCGVYLSVRCIMRCASSTSIFSRTAFGSSMTVLDMFHCGPALSVRAFIRLGGAISVAASQKMIVGGSDSPHEYDYIYVDSSFSQEALLAWATSSVCWTTALSVAICPCGTTSAWVSRWVFSRPLIVALACRR